MSKQSTFSRRFLALPEASRTLPEATKALPELPEAQNDEFIKNLKSSFVREQFFFFFLEVPKAEKVLQKWQKCSKVLKSTQKYSKGFAAGGKREWNKKKGLSAFRGMPVWFLQKPKASDQQEFPTLTLLFLPSF